MTDILEIEERGGGRSCVDPAWIAGVALPCRVRDQQSPAKNSDNDYDSGSL